MPLTAEQIQKMDAITGLGGEQEPPAAATGLTPEKIAQMDEITGMGEKPGFLKRVGQDFVKRNEMGNEILNAPDRSEGAKTLQYIGKVGGGFANDIIKEGAETIIPPVLKAASYLPGMESYNKAVTQTGQGILNSAVGKMGLKALQRGGAEWDLFKKKNPSAAASIEAGGNMLMLGTGVAAADAALPAVRAAVNSADLSTALRNAPKPEAKTQGTSADLKGLAAEGYDEAAWSGESFAPDHVSNKFSQAMQNAKPKPIAGQVVPSEHTALIKDIEEYAGLAGKPMTLNDVTALDQSLSMKINKYIDAKTGLPDANGMHLMELQDSLRDLVDTSPGGEIIKSARTLWAAQRRLKDVENIIERASMTQVPGTSMQNGFRNLYMNPKRMRGWSAEERLLLKKAAETGIVDDLLGVVGSRLNVIAQAAAGGGLGGAAAAHITGMAGRGLRAKVISGRAQKLGDKMVDRALRESDLPPRAAPEYPPPEPQKLLPKPETEYVSDAAGNTRAMTPEEKVAAVAARQEAADLGLTSDVTKNINRIKLRERIGNAWDAIEKAQQDKIAADIEAAWRANPKTPIKDLIDAAKASAEELAAAKGETGGVGTLGEALLKARGMKPEDAKKLINSKMRKK